MRFVRSCAVDVAAPAKAVYPLVADLTQHPRWVYNKLTMKHVSGDGVGARYHSEVREAVPGSKKPVPGDIEVVEVVPDSRFVFEAKDSAGKYRWTYTFGETDGRTRVEQTCERLHGPFPIPLIQPLLWAMVGRKQVQGGLDKLKSIAEAEATMPEPRVIELPADQPETSSTT